MSRRLRYVPGPAVVEVTCRTIQGRFLLKPSPPLARLAIGVLARAQRTYDVRIHAFCLMSNHYHLLLTAQNALQLARFMNYVQSNLAREAGRLAGWKERFWGRRYQAILVSDEADAQLARLRYILSQGCKEGIVARPEDWQGAHCVRQLMRGESTLRGQWIDRTAIYREASRQQRPEIAKFTTEETLVLTPLPCFDNVATEQQIKWIRDCIDQIAGEARRDHKGRSRPAGGRRKAGRHPHALQPQPIKRRPAPWFHVVSAAAARKLRDAYALFSSLYRSAAQKLKEGLEVEFPAGSFPPARPYVSA